MKNKTIILSLLGSKREDWREDINRSIRSYPLCRGGVSLEPQNKNHLVGFCMVPGEEVGERKAVEKYWEL